MSRQKRIAIVGGGIAGLTFARCLDDNSYECHIFEKKRTFGEIGAAISVFPNALCIMDAIGLLNPILENSGRIDRVYLKTHKGRILSSSRPNYDYPTVCTHRAALHKVLMDGVNAKLYTDHEVSSFTHRDDGRVRLDFKNGVSDTFDAVIGADGIHSAARQHVIGDGDPIFRGYNIWRGVVKTEFDAGYGSETYGFGQRVGIVPIRDGVYGWWATCNEDYMQDDAPEQTRNKLLRIFGDWHDPIPELIQNTQNILKNSLCDRLPTRGWSNGNVVLIGDAAHPTTPNLGQGGCMAMEGAYLLAKSISKYGLKKAAYVRYEELHFPRAASVVRDSLQLGKIGQISNPIMARLRNLAFKSAPSSMAMKMIDKYFSYKVTEIDI